MKNGDIDLKALVRSIPDFPKPGIMFRDITTLIDDRSASPARSTNSPRPIATTDRRGGGHRGARLHRRRGGIAPARLGDDPDRKKGKLPWRAHRQEYQLEYGTDCIEMHEDAMRAGERC